MDADDEIRIVVVSHQERKITVGEYVEAKTAAICKERDELAAQVEVMRDALVCTDKYLVEAESALGGGDDELNLEPAILQCRAALSITGPDALREIQARTLEEAATQICDLSTSDFPSRQLTAMAAAKRKGE